MNEITTNGLIASLRALTHEAVRVERQLDDAGMDDELGEELGLYLNDLHEVVAAISDEYERRRRSSEELAHVDALLALWAKE